MYFIILVIIILVISVALLLRLVWRHLPELRALDLSAIPQEKQDSTKAKILEAKFLRQNKITAAKINKIMTPAKEWLAGLSKKLSQQIDVLEKKYRRQEVIEETRIKSIDELTAEALAQLEKGEYALAEKNLIEIIARDKKNFSAYELLAEIYRLNRSYDQAEEVLKYLIKLKSLRYRRSGQEPLKKVKFEDMETAVLQAVDIDHDLSRYYDDLAKVYEAMDKRGRALDAYLKANTILPNNPKFLDKITELAIAEKDIGLAKKTFRQLREINPDNAKLLHFFEALEKMK